jgi:hypothetical protein
MSGGFIDVKRSQLDLVRKLKNADFEKKNLEVNKK